MADMSPSDAIKLGALVIRRASPQMPDAAKGGFRQGVQAVVSELLDLPMYGERAQLINDLIVEEVKGLERADRMIQVTAALADKQAARPANFEQLMEELANAIARGDYAAAEERLRQIDPELLPKKAL